MPLPELLLFRARKSLFVPQYAEQFLHGGLAVNDFFHALFSQTAFAFFLVLFSQLRQGHVVVEYILFYSVVYYEQVVDSDPSLVPCIVTFIAAGRLTHLVGVYLVLAEIIDLSRSELGWSFAFLTEKANKSL